MTEAEARALLAAFDGLGGLEAWIAARPWEVEVGGWVVTEDWHGWHFKVQRVPEGLRIIAAAGRGVAPAEWIVTPKV